MACQLRSRATDALCIKPYLQDSLASILQLLCEDGIKKMPTLPIKLREESGYVGKAMKKRENFELKEKLLLLKTKNKNKKLC